MTRGRGGGGETCLGQKREDDVPGPGHYGAPLPLQPDTSFRFSTSKKAPTERDLVVRRAKETPSVGDYDAWDRQKLASRQQKQGGQFPKTKRSVAGDNMANWPEMSKSAPVLQMKTVQEYIYGPGPGSFDSRPLPKGTAFSIPRRDSKSFEMERLRLRNPPMPGAAQYDPQKPSKKTSFRLSSSKKAPTDLDLRIRDATRMPGPADFAPMDDARSVARQNRGATLRTSGRGMATQCEEYYKLVNPDTLALALATNQSPGPQYNVSGSFNATTTRGLSATFGCSARRVFNILKDMPGPDSYSPPLKYGKGKEANFGVTTRGKSLGKAAVFGSSRRQQPLDLAVQRGLDNQIHMGGQDLFADGYSGFKSASIRKAGARKHDPLASRLQRFEFTATLAQQKKGVVQKTPAKTVDTEALAMMGEFRKISSMTGGALQMVHGGDMLMEQAAAVLSRRERQRRDQRARGERQTVVVKDDFDRAKTVLVRPTDTVRELKRRVEAKFKSAGAGGGINRCELRRVHPCGQVGQDDDGTLRDHMRIRDAGIEPNATLYWTDLT